LRGRHLAHFELIEPIGVGGMAAVIRARDQQLDRSVALKILPPDMAGDPENVRRFHQEARAAARLDHENIARVFFCGEDQKLHFIAFEFVEGENLRVLLERRGRLPVPEAIHYMLQVATGLAHASARGVVHRDIKPSNIIISPNGRAKLVDMGLARSLEPHRDNGLTQSGVTLGTFDYISPEQALEPRDADVRSDIYSLGCTFYHMLTGQPPVPEGTAAKKLHHHQHVPPIDPRQYNPAIPDDVAAILAHMMAKDPKDRYQRAEHLVQHLIQVAQKLGAVTEAPDGVLFVDAPLPEPPRKRPALMAAVAMIALSTLLAILSLAPTDPSPLPGPDHARSGPDKDPRDLGGASEDNARPKVGAREEQGIVRVKTVDELAAALAKKQPIKHIYLMNDLLLRPADNPAAGQVANLIYRGDPDHPLTLESAPEVGVRFAVTVTWPASSPEVNPRGANPRVGLTVASGKLTLRRLHFEVRGKVPGAGGRLRLAVLAASGGNLVVQRCTFAQTEGVSASTSREERPKVPIPVAMVAVEGAASNHSDLSLEECYFERAQSAVTLTGQQVAVRANNCAFGPHAVLFHLRGGGTRATNRIRLRNCSAFVVDGPVFRLDKDAACSLEVDHSVFSCPASRSGWEDLILQTDTVSRDQVRFYGRRNCYHNLNSFWKRYHPDRSRDPIFQSAYPDFKSELDRPSRDDASEALDPSTNPWASLNPLEPDEEDGKVYLLRLDLPQLRHQDDPGKMIGVTLWLGKPLYPEKLPDLQEKRPQPVVKGANVRVVDPDAGNNTGKRVYLSLEGALADAKPGDEIQIKRNGLLRVTPMRLDKANVDLKIKPYPDYHPILTLGETTQKEAALFLLHDGQVQFEQLEFQVKPNKDFDFQAVMEMIGNGRCTFKECVVTLLEAADKGDIDKGEGKRPSVIRLSDPGKAMKMGTQPARALPELRLVDCFVRGQGDLVLVQPSRPLDLDIQNAMLALDGSLLHVDGTGKEPPAASATTDNNHVIKLANVTAYLTEDLLRLRAKTGKGLVGTLVKKASDCLFVAAGKKPLIQLDGVDSEEQMKRLFSWEGSRHNAYLNFETMLDSPRSSYSRDDWQKPPNNVEDTKPGFANCKKLKRALSLLVPGDFKDLKADDSKLELTAFGANLEKLPRLTPAEGPDTENQ
jgi:serine/threonine protein kinase